MEADLESYSTANLGHLLFIEKENISEGGAKSQGGRTKSHGKEITYKMAGQVSIPLPMLLGSVLPHCLGACHVTSISGCDISKLDLSRGLRVLVHWGASFS